MLAGRWDKRGKSSSHPLHMALSSLGTTELQLTHCLGILAINHNRNVKIITLLRINKDLGLF